MSDLPTGLPEASPEVHSAFQRLLLGLADTKRILGIRYSDWLLGAPSIEAGIAASSMAQDEWGHARLLYATLRDFGEDPELLEHDRPASEYASWDPLDEPFADWAAVTAGMTVVDGALALALEAVLEGEYEPLRGRLEKMLGEEEFHRSLAHAWFSRLSRSSGGGRERLREAVEAVLPATLRCLAPDDRTHRRLEQAGLTLSAAELRTRLARLLDPLLDPLDLSVPAVPAEVPEGWDGTRGRGPGHPAEEAVERARGDLNRALFVE
jgi:ring-1,2-phenylacetyl-CoA epoxidase subunit PaaC